MWAKPSAIADEISPLILWIWIRIFKKVSESICSATVSCSVSSGVLVNRSSRWSMKDNTATASAFRVPAQELKSPLSKKVIGRSRHDPGSDRRDEVGRTLNPVLLAARLEIEEWGNSHGSIRVQEGQPLQSAFSAAWSQARCSRCAPRREGRTRRPWRWAYVSRFPLA